MNNLKNESSLEWLQVDPSNQHFIGQQSGQRFTPLGFNYDHDENHRLIEDYWHHDWDKIVTDFKAMRKLGANLIRIHLQLGKFVLSPTQENTVELKQLDRLIALAEALGLYLDLVGLGCYHKKDVPTWYDELHWQERWQVQAFFWQNIAKRYSNNATIFCYDLMNEPIVPGGQRKKDAWLGPEFDGATFVQFIKLNGKEEPRIETAVKWIRCLTESIRPYDDKRLITVGLVDWSIDKPGLTSGFSPKAIVNDVDFIAAHLYPESGKSREMTETLKAFCVGKPVVIDETFHLKCVVEEEIDFLQQAQHLAEGFLGFYTDFVKDPDTAEKMIRNIGIKEWLAIFTQCAPLFGDSKFQK